MNGFGYQGNYNGGCTCNFSTLIVLILILLQFGKGRNKVYEDKYEDGCETEKEYGIDNGILFIIAIFYLSCVLQCK